MAKVIGWVVMVGIGGYFVSVGYRTKKQGDGTLSGAKKVIRGDWDWLKNKVDSRLQEVK